MNRTFAVALVAAALAAAAAAQAQAPLRTGIHWGEARPLGAGSASAWVAVDVDGTPCSMGVSIDEAALRGDRGKGRLEAVVPLPADIVAAGAAGNGPRPAFRVRYDRERRAYLVMLDGVNPVAGLPGAPTAQDVTR
jgi:hypothetical protein